MPRPPRFTLALQDQADPMPLCLFPPGPDGLPPGSLCAHPHFGVHQRLVHAGLTMTPLDELPQAQTAIVFTTRSRAQTLGAVAAALGALAPGGRLVLDGAKGDGIDGLIKTLKQHLSALGTASRDHGKVAWFTRPVDVPGITRPWAEAAAPMRGADGVWRQAGAFSADGLDPGTALLLEHLPPANPGTVADFGAGWGGLSLGLATAFPAAQLDLIEVDAQALSLGRRNLEHHSLARFHWADVTRLPTGLDGYDLIASNPPFHASRKADPSLGVAFIQAAARALSPRGRFAMVANRQLAYEATLDGCFAQWDTITQTPTYKIIHASRPHRTPA
ncbi:MAG: methyltransferase [Pseudomonadota bacterium]